MGIRTSYHAQAKSIILNFGNCPVPIIESSLTKNGGSSLRSHVASMHIKHKLNESLAQDAQEPDKPKTSPGELGCSFLVQKPLSVAQMS